MDAFDEAKANHERRRKAIDRQYHLRLAMIVAVIMFIMLAPVVAILCKRWFGA